VPESATEVGQLVPVQLMFKAGANTPAVVGLNTT
jgi:hypothetical protein